MENLYYSTRCKKIYELVFNSTYSSDLLYYTNGSYRVFCWSFVWMKCSMIEEVSMWEEGREARAQAWGCPRHPSKYSRRLQRLRLGMPRKASPSFFNKYRYVFVFVSFMRYVQVLERLLHLSFYFSFMHHAGMR